MVTVNVMLAVVFPCIITLMNLRGCGDGLWWRWTPRAAGISWWKCSTASLHLQSQPCEPKTLIGKSECYPGILELRFMLCLLKGATNSWLRVIPRTKFGAFARGAKVVVYTKKTGPHTRIIDGGSGYLCEMEPVAHFGLGKCAFSKNI